MNENSNNISNEEIKEQKCTKYTERTAIVCVILLAVYLLFCIFRAGIWNLIILILAALVFVGLFIGTENVILKGFWGLCCIIATLRVIFAILGKYGLLILIGYIVLSLIACYIASKIDEREDLKNKQY